jgi:hypothetical protein
MRTPALAAVAVAVLGAGCIVGVEIEKVEDPGPAFAEARREASRLEGRSGRPKNLRVLVYDREEGELVRASLPLWMVEKMDDEGVNLDLGDETEERVRARIRPRDLKNAPLGPLVEVDEEDGDQVLVWLE